MEYFLIVVYVAAIYSIGFWQGVRWHDRPYEESLPMAAPVNVDVVAPGADYSVPPLPPIIIFVPSEQDDMATVEWEQG